MIEQVGPFDPDELVQWAEMYGHPEEWAKKAQAAHGRAESLDKRLGSLVNAGNDLWKLVNDHACFLDDENWGHRKEYVQSWLDNWRAAVSNETPFSSPPPPPQIAKR